MNKTYNFKIGEFPSLQLAYLLDHRKHGNHWGQSYGKNAIFLYRGRYAVWQAAKAVLTKGQGTILMPAFHCGVEVEAVQRAGMKVSFYNVKPNLQIDLQDLENRITASTKAVFIIHYFGFPQPLEEIAEICKRYQLYLIEDVAHALMSQYRDRFLGTCGDLAIFSLRKTLPVPDGAAIVFNNSDLKLPLITKQPSLMMVLRAIIALYCHHLERENNKRFFKTILLHLLESLRLPSTFNEEVPSQNAYVEDDPSWMEFEEDMTNVGMSTAARRVMSSLDWNWIVEMRRRNYMYLLQKFAGTRPASIVFPYLEAGICPLFFPIYVENREILHQELLQQGISTFIFGKVLHSSLPRHGFEVARKLSNQILALPVDQELTKFQLGYMIDAVNKLLSLPMLRPAPNQPSQTVEREPLFYSASNERDMPPCLCL